MWIVRVGGRGRGLARAPKLSVASRALLHSAAVGGGARRQLRWQDGPVLGRWPWQPRVPSSSSRSTATAAGETNAGQGSEDTKAKKDKDKPMGWGMFWLYISGGVSGIVTLWHFYKAGGNLHKTEIRLLESFRKLPFYWPPGPPEAHANTMLDPEGLDPELVDVFTQWFLGTDLLVPEGVTRDDVLELVAELGFAEEERPCKDFLYRGEGELEERKRLSGCGLQETLSLLAQLSRLPAPAPKKNAEAEETAADAPRRTGAQRLGPDGIAIFRRKIKGFSSVMSGATMLQQAMQAPASGGGTAPAASSQQRPAAPAFGAGFGFVGGAQLEEDDSASEVDEAEQRKLEIAILDRQEKDLVSRLERVGSLSPAEERRLNDIRTRKAAALKS